MRTNEKLGEVPEEFQQHSVNECLYSMLKDAERAGWDYILYRMSIVSDPHPVMYSLNMISTGELLLGIKFSAFTPMTLSARKCLLKLPCLQFLYGHLSSNASRLRKFYGDRIFELASEMVAAQVYDFKPLWDEGFMLAHPDLYGFKKDLSTEQYCALLRKHVLDKFGQGGAPQPKNQWKQGKGTPQPQSGGQQGQQGQPNGQQSNQSANGQAGQGQTPSGQGQGSQSQQTQSPNNQGNGGQQGQSQGQGTGQAQQGPAQGSGGGKSSQPRGHTSGRANSEQDLAKKNLPKALSSSENDSNLLNTPPDWIKNGKIDQDKLKEAIARGEVMVGNIGELNQQATGQIADATAKEILSGAFNRTNIKNQGWFRGEASEFIKSLHREPVIEWIDYLREKESHHTDLLREPTRRRLSRRHSTYFGRKHKSRCQVMVWIDTSGSMSPRELKLIQSELQAMVRRGAMVKVAMCDADVQKAPVEFKENTELDQFFGGGEIGRAHV